MHLKKSRYYLHSPILPALNFFFVYALLILSPAIVKCNNRVAVVNFFIVNDLLPGVPLLTIQMSVKQIPAHLTYGKKLY